KPMKMRPGTQTGFLLCGKEWIEGESLEVRSPWDQGLVGRVTVATRAAARLGGENIPLDLTEGNEGRWGVMQRFPVGPVLAITPFNFPLNLVAHKVAPALAAGCPLILKPAPQTPFTALALGEV